VDQPTDQLGEREHEGQIEEQLHRVCGEVLGALRNLDAPHSGGL